MHDQARQVPGRQVPVHRWLFGLAIGLTIAAVPHVAWVFSQHLPGAIVTSHLCTTVGLFLYAEMRRDSWDRSRKQSKQVGELAELVAAVERP